MAGVIITDEEFHELQMAHVEAFNAVVAFNKAATSSDDSKRNGKNPKVFIEDLINSMDDKTDKGNGKWDGYMKTGTGYPHLHAVCATQTISGEVAKVGCYKAFVTFGDSAAFPNWAIWSTGTVELRTATVDIPDKANLDQEFPLEKAVVENDYLNNPAFGKTLADILDVMREFTNKVNALL